jgi:hypothetical protein
MSGEIYGMFFYHISLPFLKQSRHCALEKVLMEDGVRNGGFISTGQHHVLTIPQLHTKQ